MTDRPWELTHRRYVEGSDGKFEDVRVMVNATQNEVARQLERERDRDAAYEFYVTEWDRDPDAHPYTATILSQTNGEYWLEGRRDER